MYGEACKRGTGSGRLWPPPAPPPPQLDSGRIFLGWVTHITLKPAPSAWISVQIFSFVLLFCFCLYSLVTIVDIDECEDKPCHHKAVCQNERGSYTCTCVKGFAGDGHECVEDLAYKQKQKIKQIMTIGGAAGGGTLFLIALIACFLGARKKKPKEEKIEDTDSTITVHSRWESSEESDDDDE